MSSIRYTERSDIQASIYRLECILTNWDTLANADDCAIVQLDGYRIHVDYGLCFNCGFKRWSDGLVCRMFEAWPDYSGSESYPVDSMDEYDTEYRFNKFQNPQRRYLAEHCLQYLKEWYANVT